MSRAHTLAVDASFQALANCYLREVNTGLWHTSTGFQQATHVALTRSETHVVELPLVGQAKTLAVGVAFRSLVGRHTLTDAYERSNLSDTWRPIDLFSATLLLIDDVYTDDKHSARRVELLGRVIESHQVMSAFLERRLKHNHPSRQKVGQSFIESEQSVVLGHWLHPTPKSRQGIHHWQHAHYSPELGGHFQLHFFAASRKLVEQASLLESSAEQLSRHIASLGSSVERYQKLVSSLSDHYCWLPVHPLQAQWLLHQDYVRELLVQKQLLDLGPLGPEFTATSSVRTVYCESLDFMLKLSMPVKITNSLRINLKSELGDSVWITKLLRVCGISQHFPDLRPIEDPAYITLSLPNREETGFEVIFRGNPFRRSNKSEQTVQSVAALVQDPLPGQTHSQLALHVRSIADAERCSLEQAGRRWFDAYFRCAIQSALEVYDKFGIGLEAHQQNALLEFSVSGYPTFCHYRDIQGLALSESARRPLLRLVPELAQQPKVFEDDEIVRNGFGYYVFFNQLYSVINRLALDDLLDEESALTTVHERLTTLKPRLHDFGAAFVEIMLEQPSVPCKANLLTRIADMDELQAENELAVYVKTDNPLARVGSLTPKTLRSPPCTDTRATETNTNVQE